MHRAIRDFQAMCVSKIDPKKFIADLRMVKQTQDDLRGILEEAKKAPKLAAFMGDKLKVVKQRLSQSFQVLEVLRKRVIDQQKEIPKKMECMQTLLERLIQMRGHVSVVLLKEVNKLNRNYLSPYIESLKPVIKKARKEEPKRLRFLKTKIDALLKLLTKEWRAEEEVRTRRIS